MTQTWRIFCGLVGLVGHGAPCQCHSKVEELKDSPTLLTLPCGLPQAHAHTFLPLEEALGEEFFFFNKENIASIHLGLQTQVHTHKYLFIYFLEMNSIPTLSSHPVGGWEIQSSLAPPVLWLQAAPGSGFMWCLEKGKCLQPFMSQNPGLSVPLKSGGMGSWGSCMGQRLSWSSLLRSYHLPPQEPTLLYGCPCSFKTHHGLIYP